MYCKISNVIKRLSFVGPACTHTSYYKALEWCRSAVAQTDSHSADWTGLGAAPAAD